MEKTKGYRDRIYIIKDIILTLSEYGELNQTSLISFCGLNLKKHKRVLEQLEKNEMIQREERMEGKRSITFFRPTVKGLKFCSDIIGPYEELFPRNIKEPKKSLTLILI